MRNQKVVINEIRLRLMAPIISLERIAAGKYLPKIFAEVSLGELQRIKKLLRKKERSP
jgi:hypothetical protein